MKQQFLNKIIFFVLLTVILVSCAQYRPPAGGPLDTTPPVLDTAMSSQLFRTNFKKGDITLNFDEWLKAGNAQQVLVSPPLEFNPKISTRGKSVVFEFNEKEVLRDSTTYVINFGEYISDLNEGNIIPNMVYVFSTGDIIDSLSISTKVQIEGEEKVPEAAILLIYNTSRDSNVLDTKPLYAGFSDKSGNIKVGYMAPGTYYVYALVDKNANYTFDGGEEMVGFVADSIELKEEIQLPVISLFSEDPKIAKPILAKKSNGRQTLTYNQNPGEIRITDIPENVRFSFKKENEVLTIYHYAEDSITWDLMIENSLGMRDTINIKSDSLKAGFMPGVPFPLKMEANLVNTDSKIERVTFPNPIFKLEPELIELEILKDSLHIPVKTPVNIQLSESRWQMDLEHNWLGDTTYRLRLLPGALESIWATKNIDTLLVEIKTNVKTNYGIIDIILSDLDSSEQYLYELLLGEKIIASGKIIDKTEDILSFRRILPGAYSLKMVLDKNKNGRADLGSVLEKRRAEPIIERDLDELRADWDLELEINVKEAINK